MATLALPIQTTSFVGRDRELAEIAVLLADPACRLLTLVGSGGIGKTRLALQAASETASLFPDGVRFAALQPISSVTFLIAALADALQFQFYGPASPRTQLLQRLATLDLLLIIDNFEHLLDDTALLVEILEAAPRVKLLVTSRETLNVREEWVRVVEPMAVPADDSLHDAEHYDAVRLFVERARQGRGDFDLGRDLAHVLRVCRLVDGLPLALELAAARIRVLSCEQIADELQRSMDVLATSLHNVPARHHDLYALFEPCWQRLSQEQRDVFMRLSVFRGGFTREAAEVVAGASPPVLDTLIEKSLLRLTPTGRCEMHELVRQYAEVRLHEQPPDEGEHTQDCHCTYYASFLEQRERDLKGARMLPALSEIRPEMDNIRVMWRRAVEQSNWDAIAGCMNSLGFVIQNRGRFHEGAETFGLAVQALGGEPSVLLGRLLMWQAHLNCGNGHGEEPDRLLRTAVKTMRPFGLHHADPMCYQHIPCLWITPDDLEELRQIMDDTLAHFRAAGDRWGVANTLVLGPGLTAVMHGEFRQAEACLAEALALYRETGNLWGVSSALHSMHEVTINQGKYGEARRYAEECAAIGEAIDDQPGFAIALFRMAKVDYALGRYQDAQALAERSLTLCKQLMLSNAADMFEFPILGALACRLGNYAESREYFQIALRQALDYPRPVSFAQTLAFLAQLLAATGQPARAVEVVSAALPWLTHFELDRRESAQLLVAWEAQLSPEEFAAARLRGESDDLAALAADLLAELEAEDASSTCPPSFQQPLIEPLSARELEVLRLVAEGWSNREIAQHLVVTVGTVKKHLNNIFGKLDAHSRTQAISRARSQGLLPK